MKTKLIYLMGFILICILSCSKDDDNKVKVPCFLYSIFVSDNCDCPDMDFNCGNLYFISESEYVRLLDVLANSNEPCNYIESIELATDENFEGYLIDINKSSCPD